MRTKTETWNGFEIRFVENNGEWWAVAQDIAAALSYKLTTNMTKLIGKSDKGIAKVNTPGGIQKLLIISEFGIYDAVFGSHKPEAKEFKRWVHQMLKELRVQSGLEGFQIFRMLDKDHQKEVMHNLCQGLKSPKRVDFIKANTIANKTVSTVNGYPKMLKKGEMSPEMLIQRQPILEDAVNLMVANDSFGLGLSVSGKVYDKYLK